MYNNRMLQGYSWGVIVRLVPGDTLPPGDSLRPTISMGLSSRAAEVWHKDECFAYLQPPQQQ